MDPFLIALLIGLLAGMAAGAFGIGGATVSAPLMRLLLGSSGHAAVGTSLPLAIPAALSGLYVFGRKGLVDWRVVIVAGFSGAASSAIGALFTTSFSDSHLMALLGLVLIASAGLVLYRGRTPASSHGADKGGSLSMPKAAVVGAFVGFLSGFLSIGGGTFLVPLFAIVLGMPLHAAIASSLGAILIFAISGTATHLTLGHVDLACLLPMLASSIIGAQLGSRFILNQGERATAIAIAAFYAATGIILVCSELLAWGGA